MWRWVGGRFLFCWSVCVLGEGGVTEFLLELSDVCVEGVDVVGLEF